MYKTEQKNPNLLEPAALYSLLPNSTTFEFHCSLLIVLFPRRKLDISMVVNAVIGTLYQQQGSIRDESCKSIRKSWGWA